MEEHDFMKGHKKKLADLHLEYVHPFDEDDNIGMLFENDENEQKEEISEK